ncbi:unnamed protein product [Caenorhabditis nigoni]
MAEKKEKKEEKDSDVFVLKLNPEAICFSNSGLGDENTMASLKLTNPTKEKYAFKIKCTSNEMFKIKSPVGIIKPDESLDIGVIHCSGKAIPENNKQYFAVYYVKVQDSVKPTEVRDIWKEKKNKHDGMKRVYISFEKGAGTTFEDKKKEKKKDGDGEKPKTEEGKKEKESVEEKKEEKEEKKDEKKEDEEKK